MDAQIRERPRKMTPDERATHRAALIARSSTPAARLWRFERDEATINQAVKSTLMHMEACSLGLGDLDAVVETMAVRRHRPEVRYRARAALEASSTAPRGLPERTEYLPPPTSSKVAGATCRYCPSPAEAIDHVWPRARGGDDHPNNLVPACRACNASKSSHSWLTMRCPACEAFRDPGDVVTATQTAYYACRCGTSWSQVWDLQNVKPRQARPSGW